MSQIIVTYKAAYREIAYNEINKLAPGSKMVKHFTDGIMLVNLSCEFSEFISRYNGSNLVFLQHLFPVTQTMDNSNFSLNNFVNACSEKPVRKLHYRDVIGQKKEFDILQNSANSEPANQIINVFFADKVYIGECLIAQTTTTKNGGEYTYVRDNLFISRAEYKLAEAIELFEINMRAVKCAVDLGAAPGGWSKVLSQYCKKVIAVDPAELDARVLSLDVVEHFKGVAQEFDFSGLNIDFIVNDMRMDAAKSAKILIDISKNLSIAGHAIITLKLPESSPYKAMNKTLDLLKLYFEIANVRQLYHNRNEVTVHLLKR